MRRRAARERCRGVVFTVPDAQALRTARSPASTVMPTGSGVVSGILRPMRPSCWPRRSTAAPPPGHPPPLLRSRPAGLAVSVRVLPPVRAGPLVSSRAERCRVVDGAASKSGVRKHRGLNPPLRHSHHSRPWPVSARRGRLGLGRALKRGTAHRGFVPPSATFSGPRYHPRAVLNGEWQYPVPAIRSSRAGSPARARACRQGRR